MSKATGHTAAPRGKRVMVKLKAGGYVSGKFHERTAREIVLDNGEVRISKKLVKAVTIFRETSCTGYKNSVG